jgi:hypothetical protein
MPFPASWAPEGASLEVDAAPDGSSCTIGGKIDYADLASLLSYVFPGGDYGVQCTVSGLTYLRAHRMSLRGFTKSGEVAVDGVSAPKNGLVVKIGYATVPALDTPGQQQNGNADPITLLEHRWTSSVEVIETGVEGMQWAEDSQAVENEIQGTIKVPMIEHEITKPRWQNPPFDAIKGLLGRVNESVMTFQTGIILPETLLFMGCGLSRAILSNGDAAWNLSYRFSERRVKAADTGVDDQNGTETEFGGWNHFYRKFYDEDAGTPVYPGFYRLERANGDPIYELGAMLGLFPNTL